MTARMFNRLMAKRPRRPHERPPSQILTKDERPPDWWERAPAVGFFALALQQAIRMRESKEARTMSVGPRPAPEGRDTLDLPGIS